MVSTASKEYDNGFARLARSDSMCARRSWPDSTDQYRQHQTQYRPKDGHIGPQDSEVAHVPAGRCFVSLLFFQIHMLKYSSILSLSLL